MSQKELLRRCARKRLPKVLIVHELGSEKLGDYFRIDLRVLGYATRVVFRGKHAKWLLRVERYDALVLGPNLPDIEVGEFGEWLRKQYPMMPLIVMHPVVAEQRLAFDGRIMIPDSGNALEVALAEMFYPERIVK